MTAGGYGSRGQAREPVGGLVAPQQRTLGIGSGNGAEARRRRIRRTASRVIVATFLRQRFQQELTGQSAELAAATAAESPDPKTLLKRNASGQLAAAIAGF